VRTVLGLALRYLLPTHNPPTPKIDPPIRVSQPLRGGRIQKSIAPGLIADGIRTFARNCSLALPFGPGLSYISPGDEALICAGKHRDHKKRAEEEERQSKRGLLLLQDKTRDDA
jgi:hypothetical protein